MGILGIVFVAEGVGFFRTVFRSEKLGHEFPDGISGLGSQTGGVGSHVGNETCRTFTHIHPFIQLLGYHHGATGRKVQFMGCFLLQGTGCKGRQRTAGNVFAEGRFHFISSLFQVGFHSQGILGVMQFQLRPGFFHNLGRKDRCLGIFPQFCPDGPEFFRYKFGNGLIPVGNDLYRYRLYTAGAQALADLPPQQRAQLVAYQTVDDAAGLLGVYHGPVNGAGML